MAESEAGLRLGTVPGAASQNRAYGELPASDSECATLTAEAEASGRPFWRWLALAAALAALYYSVFWRLVGQWWTDANYSHGFLVPIFFGFLIWERRKHLRQLPANPRWSGLLVILASLAVFFAGTLGAELFLTRISLVGVAVGLALFLHGWAMVRALRWPFAVLLLMIPIPGVVYNQIVFPLQLLASQLATFFLQTAHLFPVLREGNVLVLPNTRLEVAEACSGIRSLMSMLTLSVFYGYFAETRNWVRLLLCLVVVPVAVFSNAVRVVSAAVGAEYWGESVAEGTVHLMSGIVLFLASTLTLIGFHLLLRAGGGWLTHREGRA
jgi:exosortase